MMAPALSKQAKILAVSSSGGHWIELLRLREAFAGHRVVYVTTRADSAAQIPGERLRIVPDAHRSSYFDLVALMIKILVIVMLERPDFVVSTGAACGYFALRWGKMFRARTIWLESVANSEEFSLSTKLVKPYADLFLTQWPHMAQPDGPYYRGSVL